MAQNKTDKVYYQSFLTVILMVGIVWLMSGLPKLAEGKFPYILEGVLQQFASKNPVSFYKSFLESVAIPNAVTFGWLVSYGETLNGIAITVSTLYLLIKNNRNKMIEWLLLTGLVGGIFLNTNFLLGGGWTSITKMSLNITLILIESAALVGVYRIFFKQN